MRYESGFILKKNQHIKTCPIVIVGGRILKDKISDKNLIQLKLKNIGVKNIISIFLIINCKKKDNSEEKIKYQYSDINLCVSECYGEQHPIFLEDDDIQNFSINICKVEYIDKEIWENKNYSISIIDEPVLLSEKLPEELIEQYHQMDIRCREDKYFFQESADTWICTCGTINLGQENICSICHKEKEWIKIHIQRNYLDKKNVEEKERKEEIAYYKKIEKEKRKSIAKKEKKILYGILVIFVLLISTIYIDNNIYPNIIEEIQKKEQEKEREEKKEKIKNSLENLDKKYVNNIVNNLITKKKFEEILGYEIEVLYPYTQVDSNEINYNLGDIEGKIKYRYCNDIILEGKESAKFIVDYLQWIPQSYNKEQEYIVDVLDDLYGEHEEEENEDRRFLVWSHYENEKMNEYDIIYEYGNSYIYFTDNYIPFLQLLY